MARPLKIKMPADPGDPLVKPSDAAIQLGVSVWTIYRWIEHGKLRAHKLTIRAVRVSQDSIDEMKRSTIVSGEAPAKPQPRRRASVRTRQHAAAMAKLADLGISV